MSQLLHSLTFPLHGSRLIEASAGTGKTWTIAALYVRLVLGHGGEDGHRRPLMPADILVMTFTRAATRELSNRVRERLIEAAAHFRGQAAAADPYLDALLGSYPSHEERQRAAHRLMLAAETMDEAAIFTIDAWCQRMLREHAFDSGSLFDEELVSDEAALFEDAAHDYWRQQVYPLNAQALDALLACWPDVEVLKRSVGELARRAELLAEQAGAPDESLSALITRVQRFQRSQLLELKEGWCERANRMEQWIAREREAAPKCFNGVKMKPETLVKWFDGLRAWAQDDAMVQPDISDTAWRRLTTAGIEDACAKGYSPAIPDDFEHTAALAEGLARLEPLRHPLYRHAAAAIARRMAELKKRARQFGFADMLERLRLALLGANGAALRKRITEQYPVAMVDEFQDTAPSQYQIFDLLYRVADNDPALGLFLIGDPKQSIYGFRGADIHSYLSARRATEGRHYQLGTNYRSTAPLVAAVNQVFLHAEGAGQSGGFERGAFRFRTPDGNPLPFDAVDASGRKELLVGAQGQVEALLVSCTPSEDMKAEAYRDFFAHHCAEHIVCLLNDPHAGFDGPQGFKRLQPADIAVLVRDRREASAIRRALQRRKVASVYLSDKDSVLESEEAADVLRWLSALASPLDGGLARAAFATRTAGLGMAELARLSSDELAWEERVEQLKTLHIVWQRQGVLAMLRRFIHELKLPAALLRQAGGERRLTNLLHLAELLQSASRQLDGEQALIRWLAEQIEGGGEGGDERVLRLESDAELVKVVTVHKSKGLEYPLVYLPFAVTARKAERRNRSFLEYTDARGARHIDMALSDEALEAVEAARIAEDLRLLYVALTRPRHFLWLGVAALAARKAGENTLHDSALGYLLTGGEPLPAGELASRWERVRGGCDAISVRMLEEAGAVTMLDRVEQRPQLIAALRFEGDFERDWTVGSFTSLARRGNQAGAPRTVNAVATPAAPVVPPAADDPFETVDAAIAPASGGAGMDGAYVPRTALQEKLLEAAASQDAARAAGGVSAAAHATAAHTSNAHAAAPRALAAAPLRPEDAPWHRFPRGSVPGNFLHEQLEWMGQEGFGEVLDPHFDTRLIRRIERAGWAHRQDDTVAWLRAIATEPLPHLDAPLASLEAVLPEMEFWFPSENLSSGALDRLCRRHLLQGVARPALPERRLHGMLKGFTDLVFEHEGRYWVLDYKSNALGANDAAYHTQALAHGMAEHRYDIQGAIYMLALHRLLQTRMDDYDPALHLGGAIFFFLRGIGNAQTRGCYLLEPEAALLDGLDALLRTTKGERT
ncbi:exodeoxyribonuclease V subunit beta [Pseudoduganella namucuonensis]|uniref:RecBCD enzyme subunit RecB n=1 Tax=Pseudoduganella namucuonensis TaxID=1035707 RepID=A0A1I7HVH9_9BURK|nr:exodeoxyribonuclease V subunit beta [Pseudoduganella namucuonensis]SFU64735.1 DNA helicase/exodeoxyribonuclease V, beta subunit [Pseudoduganella namucuonensis]